MRENAKVKYPDNAKALAEIQQFISDNIDHPEKWIVNEMIGQEPLLAYIWAEEEKRPVVHKLNLAEKKKH